MSSEVHKYIEDRLEKNANLFNAEVINFPNDVKVDSVKISKAKIDKFWKINDISNNDQLSAVVGICFMFGALILMGLYSNFL
jgi:DNA helicase IV